MSFVFFAWIASFLFGLAAIIGKLTSKHSIQNPWLFNFLWMLFSLFLTIPIALANGAGIPNYWGSILLVSFFSALFALLYIMSLSHLDVSVLIPLLNLRTAFISILGVLFLGEILKSNQYLMVAVILISGLFVSIDEKFSLKSFFKKPIYLALLCTLSYTFMGISIKKAISENGYWQVTLWMAILSQLMILSTFPLFKKDIRKLSLKQLFCVFIMSLCLMLGILAENRAYAQNVVITSIITALPISMILAFIFSLFVPNLLEKHTLKVYLIRFTAAAVMIIAALKLSL